MVKDRDFQFTEDIPLSPRLEMSLRVNINKAVLQAAQKNIRSIVIVPTMAYGEGIGLKKESIQVPALVKFSIEKGKGIYIEKGRISGLICILRTLLNYTYWL